MPQTKLVSAEQFLSQILPIVPNVPLTYAAMWMQDGKAMHHLTKHPMEVARICMEKSAAGFNTFYAMAGFEKGWYPCPHGTLKADGSPKKVFRKKENAIAFKSVWLDIDCGEGKAYPNVTEAIKAVAAFRSAAKLPAPTVVLSGGGLHVYWIFDTHMGKKSWMGISSRLRAAAGFAEVKADFQCTSDAARVLRVPGACNFKYDVPKQVVCHNLVTHSPAVVNDALKQYIADNNISVAVQSTATVAPQLDPRLQGFGGAFAAMDAANDKTDVPFANANKDMTLIRQRCNQIDVQAPLQYEALWAMLSVAGCCHNGKEVARAIAMTGEKWDEVNFNNKIAEIANRGRNSPASCQTFCNINAAGCAGCKHKGKIITPAQLGNISIAEREAALPSEDAALAPATVVPVYVAPPKPKEMEVNGISYIPLNSARFFIKDGAGVYAVTEKKVDGEVITKEHQLFDSCVYLTGSVRQLEHESRQKMAWMFAIVRRDKAPRTATLEVEDLSPQKALAWLANNQLMPMPGLENLAVEFIKTYIAKLQHKIAVTDVHNRFGWEQKTHLDGSTNPTFVLGDRILEPNVPPAKVVLPKKLSNYAKCVDQKGTLEAWKKVPEFYTRNNIVWGQLGLAAAFAAPLMPFAPGIAKNGILNIWSADSGTGKTTLQHAINSVWGQPERQLLNVQSTDNARFNTMGMRRNLPVCINEITNLNDTELSETIFQMSEGREKDRLSDGGKDMLASGEWSTLTLFSANNTVCDKMTKLDRARDGEIKRVLEIEIQKGHVSPAEANDMVAKMEDNYGIAGEVFIQALLDNPRLREALPQLINQKAIQLCRSQDERYWANTLAAIIIAANITNKLGLTNFDVKAIEACGVAAMDTLRNNVAEVKASVNDAVANFLNDYLANTLIVAGPAPRGRAGASNIDSMYIIRTPGGNGKLLVRKEIAGGTVAIDKRTFDSWCSDNGYTPEKALESQEHKVTRRGLGGGTQFASPRQYVYELTMDLSEEVTQDE